MYAKQRYNPLTKKTRDVEKICPVNLKLPYIYIYFFYYYYFFSHCILTLKSTEST